MSKTRNPELTTGMHAEIERRVDELSHRLAAELGDAEQGRPQWITPAELVRRMQPFLSDN